MKEGPASGKGPAAPSHLQGTTASSRHPGCSKHFQQQLPAPSDDQHFSYG